MRAFGFGQSVTIRRGHEVQDAFAALSAPGALKRPFRISYSNFEGLPEAGVDGGGLFKEFLTSLTKQAFSSSYGLFRETPDNRLYPNPASSLVQENHLELFAFLGRILGLCFSRKVLVDIPFAHFFLSKLLEKYNYLDALESLDSQMHHSLMLVKHFPGDVRDLSLFFVVAENELGHSVETELIPGGSNIPVTNENKIRYIHLIANYKLNIQIKNQSKSFLSGLTEVVPVAWLKIFSENELQLLVSGTQNAPDLVDWKAHTRYSGFEPNEEYIRIFWEVVSELTVPQMESLLRFVTSVPRAPLLGFRDLNPPFTIHKATHSTTALPSASTCMNFLKLPVYPTREILREKLLYAIESNAGFELS
eukprot:TRINITY_DN1127_c0_g1_i2.p2 TRINITY_DN1127_c0_g1~~TRINITY_DN1127_c0_g1_i2.p2  ORF type:complete len:363 (-),score=92.70 TRINITY_DN1127_c0_g1_i2:32-1120(-)